MEETPQQRQETMDWINQRLGTSPEFAKEVEDYFSKPRVFIQIPTNNLKKFSATITQNSQKLLEKKRGRSIIKLLKKLALIINLKTR